MIAWVVAPFDHEYDEPADAVRVTLPPWQNVVGPLALIEGAGSGLTVTLVAALVAEHPLALVTVTLWLPDAVTSIDWVVAPFDQRYEVPALAVRVTEPPSQNVVGPPAVIVAAGSAFTVTVVAVLVALQPAALVTVTL